MPKISDMIKNIFFVLLLLQFAPLMIKSISKQYKRVIEPRTKIGLISIKGPIYSSQAYTKAIQKMFKKDDIKGILLHIESPGGKAGSAEAVAHEILSCKKEFPKPVVCVSENFCVAEGYFIAACADHIIVSPSCLVGSIGTSLPYQFKLQVFLEEFKIHHEKAQEASEYKKPTDTFGGLNEKQSKTVASLTQSSYSQFIHHINKCRPQLMIEQEGQWAQGNTFTGMQAVGLNLVDQVGFYSDAIKKIKDLALIEGKVEWVKPETHYFFWKLLTRENKEEKEDEEIIKRLYLMLMSAPTKPI